MRALLSWIVISLGVGTVVSLVRYFAVWYIMRRVRRVLSWRRRQEVRHEQPVQH